MKKNRKINLKRYPRLKNGLIFYDSYRNVDVCLSSRHCHRSRIIFEYHTNLHNSHVLWYSKIKYRSSAMFLCEALDRINVLTKNTRYLSCSDNYISISEFTYGEYMKHQSMSFAIVSCDEKEKTPPTHH